MYLCLFWVVITLAAQNLRFKISYTADHEAFQNMLKTLPVRVWILCVNFQYLIFLSGILLFFCTLTFPTSVYKFLFLIFFFSVFKSIYKINTFSLEFRVWSVAMIWITMINPRSLGSKELMKPGPDWVHQFLWRTMIQVILDHWSRRRSCQRNAPLELLLSSVLLSNSKNHEHGNVYCVMANHIGDQDMWANHKTTV